MYPKVKVRTEGQTDKHGAHEHNWSSLLSLKDVPLLLLHDSCFPVKDYRDISPPRIARVPKSYVPNIVLPTTIVSPAESASEGSDKKSNSDEEERPNIRSDKKSKSKPNIRSGKKSSSDEGDTPNIRASSVPRPRAVLSSPDNDAVIGNKNRVKALRPSALKNHNLAQSRHMQCKTVHDQAIDVKSSPSLRKPKDKTETKIDLRTKKGSATLMPHRSDWI